MSVTSPPAPLPGRRAGAVLGAAVASALALSACGTGGPGEGTGAGTNGDGPVVVASFYPLAYVAERVAGPDASVTNLTAPGVDSHDLELGPQQVAQIADADLTLIQHDYQPAVDEAVEQNATGTVLDASDVVTLRPFDTHDDEHGDEHAGGHGQEGDHHADDGHDHGSTDPHQWLDPTNMVLITEAVRDELVAEDPEHADAYAERADVLVDELETLDADFTDGLARCDRDTVVTSHEAFGYLAERYDLHLVGIAGIDPGGEPSPARLAEVSEVVQAEDVTTIFTERLVSPAVAEALAGDLGVDIGVLDPIEGLTDETADEDYGSLMTANLEALRTANGCS